MYTTGKCICPAMETGECDGNLIGLGVHIGSSRAPALVPVAKCPHAVLHVLTDGCSQKCTKIKTVSSCVATKRKPSWEI